mmetsp:Transcript_53141/g.95694  ORF Transcript_53141/g.95694 Transcript_53141/m.95694 type:complete len:209 (-) Transcript_53141:254-880(-)
MVNPGRPALLFLLFGGSELWDPTPPILGNTPTVCVNILAESIANASADLGLIATGSLADFFNIEGAGMHAGIGGDIFTCRVRDCKGGSKQLPLSVASRLTSGETIFVSQERLRNSAANGASMALVNRSFRRFSSATSASRFSRSRRTVAVGSRAARKVWLLLGANWREGSSGSGDASSSLKLSLESFLSKFWSKAPRVSTSSSKLFSG